MHEDRGGGKRALPFCLRSPEKESLLLKAKSLSTWGEESASVCKRENDASNPLYLEIRKHMLK
jgi:hypothetical protein